MSMPIIEPSKTTRCQAVTDIIESVALQQTGLSHIINAEGEKIQAGIKYSEKDPSLMLEINNSVHNMINAITRLEVILQGKLELFKDCLCVCSEKETTNQIGVVFEINDNGGLISKTELENIYLYKPGTVRGTITILTEPTSLISQVEKLPEGWSFTGNTLITPIAPDWSVQQLVKLQIGEKDTEGAFELTLVNEVA